MIELVLCWIGGGEIKVGGGSCLLIEGNLFLIPLLTLFLFLYDPGGELAG